MTTLPLEVLRFQRPQNPGHLPAGDLDERQFLLHVSLAVGQASGEKPRIALEQFRLLEGDDTLHAVGVDRLVVRQVADHFLGGPLAGDRPCEQLVPGHAGDGTPQHAGSGKVFLDQCVVVHRVILTGGLISRLLGLTGCSDGRLLLAWHGFHPLKLILSAYAAVRCSRLPDRIAPGRTRHLPIPAVLRACDGPGCLSLPRTLSRPRDRCSLRAGTLAGLPRRSDTALPRWVGIAPPR